MTCSASYEQVIATHDPLDPNIQIMMTLLPRGAVPTLQGVFHRPLPHRGLRSPTITSPFPTHPFGAWSPQGMAGSAVLVPNRYYPGLRSIYREILSKRLRCCCYGFRFPENLSIFLTSSQAGYQSFQHYDRSMIAYACRIQALHCIKYGRQQG